MSPYECEEQFDAGRGEGGAIFNLGDIVVNGIAYFGNNKAQVTQYHRTRNQDTTVSDLLGFTSSMFCLV